MTVLHPTKDYFWREQEFVTLSNRPTSNNSVRAWVSRRRNRCWFKIKFLKHKLLKRRAQSGDPLCVHLRIYFLLWNLFCHFLLSYYEYLHS